jgi:hypothetical protein
MERYRLSAEVRHDDMDRTHQFAQATACQAVVPRGVGAPVWPQALVALRFAARDAFTLFDKPVLTQGEVGVFFMCDHYGIPQGGVIQCFCAVSFNELWKSPKRPGNPIQFNSVSLTVQSYVEKYRDPIRVRAERLGTNYIPAGHVWRKIAVEVTPEKIRVFWEDHLIGELTRKELMRSARYHIQNQPLVKMNTTPKYPTRGGLGLFVFKANASFRRVVIEPLPEDK